MEAVFWDRTTAPVSDRVRAALGFIEKLSLCPEELGPSDIEALRAEGISEEGIRDAAKVCTLFNIIVRMADTLEFAMPDSFDSSVKSLTSKRGYNMPAPLFLFPRV